MFRETTELKVPDKLTMIPFTMYITAMSMNVYLIYLLDIQRKSTK